MMTQYIKYASSNCRLPEECVHKGDVQLDLVVLLANRHTALGKPLRQAVA